MRATCPLIARSRVRRRIRVPVSSLCSTRPCAACRISQRDMASLLPVEAADGYRVVFALPEFDSFVPQRHRRINAGRALRW